MCAEERTTDRLSLSDEPELAGVLQREIFSFIRAAVVAGARRAEALQKARNLSLACAK